MSLLEEEHFDEFEGLGPSFSSRVLYCFASESGESSRYSGTHCSTFFYKSELQCELTVYKALSMEVHNKRQRSSSIESSLLHQETEARDGHANCFEEVILEGGEGPASPTEYWLSDEDKLKKRREGNRLAAQRLRAKRSEQLAKLEQENKALKCERDTYRLRVAVLEKQYQEALSQNEYLKAQLASSTFGSPHGLD